MVSLLLWFLSFLNVWAAVPTLQATPPPVRIVTMGVELAGGSMATLSVRSGDRATARLAKGPKFGLTPTLVDGGRIELVIVDISVDPASGAESTRELERRFLELNERAQFEFDGISLAVTWLGSHVRQATAEGGDPCTICCVRCDDRDYCACRVITVCGDCCCPGVCSCIITAPATADPKARPSRPPACCTAEVKQR
jgi:hypothetical protein